MCSSLFKNVINKIVPPRKESNEKEFMTIFIEENFFSSLSWSGGVGYIDLGPNPSLSLYA